MRKRIEELIKESRSSQVNEVNMMTNDNHQVLEKAKELLLEDQTIMALDYSERMVKVRKKAWKVIEDLSEGEFKGLMLSSIEKSKILESLMQVIFGFGVIDPLLKDDEITEVMVNGCDEIFYEKLGKIHFARTKSGKKLRFSHEEELKNVIDKIVAPINRKVDQSNPIVDARLPDGSRVNIVLPPISLTGPIVTIRKFPKSSFTFGDLVEKGTIDDLTSEIMKLLVKAKFNIIISGGTGSGKTTFLNALGKEIGESERVVTIEDSAELKLDQIDNLVRLEARPPNIEGEGEITIRDLVKSALRMRPDRIIVGEVRSGECVDMLQAMNTGHDGSITTVHANTARDVLSRLETMVHMSGIDLPSIAIKQQIASAVDMIVHIRKMRDGSRKVAEIQEIIGFEKGEIVTNLVGFFQETSSNEVVKGKFKYSDASITMTSKLEYVGLSADAIKKLIVEEKK